MQVMKTIWISNPQKKQKITHVARQESVAALSTSKLIKNSKNSLRNCDDRNFPPYKYFTAIAQMVIWYSSSDI